MALSRSRACLGLFFVLFYLFNPVLSACIINDEDECTCSPLGSGGMAVSCNALAVEPGEAKTISSIVEELVAEGEADSVTQL